MTGEGTLRQGPRPSRAADFHPWPATSTIAAIMESARDEILRNGPGAAAVAPGSCGRRLAITLRVPHALSLHAYYILTWGLPRELTEGDPAVRGVGNVVALGLSGWVGAAVVERIASAVQVLKRRRTGNPIARLSTWPRSSVVSRSSRRGGRVITIGVTKWDQTYLSDGAPALGETLARWRVYA